MYSPVVLLPLLVCVFQTHAHLSFLKIRGSNNVVGQAFGVNLHLKYPRVLGRPGDAGGDSGVFQTGTDNPFPACGNTPELGKLDIPAWLSQAEGRGLPSAYSNMSIVAQIFQVNRDGGGPMSCEYSEDATAHSWKPMKMIVNHDGDNGIKNVERENSTVVINFPSNARCTGGWTKTACIVRCRTGVNKRFGGCFAVKLSGAHQTHVQVVNSKRSDAVSGLNSAQLSQLAQLVVNNLKSEGLVVKATKHTSTKRKACKKHCNN